MQKLSIHGKNEKRSMQEWPGGELAQSSDFDVLVIGAGAAGLMCAAVAGQLGLRVLLLDHRQKIGEKIRISGGGRCNFTNRVVSAENFVSENPHFCKSALSQYRPADFIALVEQYGIAYHEKHRGQLFCDGSSQQIIDMLVQECALGNVQFAGGYRVAAVQALGTPGGALDLDSVEPSVGLGGKHRFGVEIATAATDESPARAGAPPGLKVTSVVLASGGLSIPKIGATDFGYRLAKQFGHSLISPQPSLVPLTFNAESFPLLPGLALPVKVDCQHVSSKKGVVSFAEDMLFTHRGLSGPAILQISNYLTIGQTITVDLAPHDDLWEVLKTAKQSGRQSVANTLQTVIPKRLVELMVPEHVSPMKVADVPDRVLREIAQSLQTLVLLATGTEGYQKAEVTRGGVNTREIHQSTMESRLCPGLFMIGEVVDVTGWLGGYNFQWAWASGVACGRAMANQHV
jgi:predicted flavoprotein YhiN